MKRDEVLAPEKIVAKCKECKRTKEITIHGNCWPCHLGRVNLNTQIEVRKNK